MKNFFFALLLISVISISFISRSSAPQTKPISFDESKAGTYAFFNHCTNEDVDVAFQSTQSMKGTVNGQKFTIKAHYNEHQQGVGRNSGNRYVGHVNNSYSEKGSFVNSRYSFSWIAKIRMMTSGGGNNYRGNNEVSYSFNTDGEVTAYVEHENSECE